MERHTGNIFLAVCYIFLHFETNQILHCLCFSDLDALPSGNDTNGGFSGQTGEKSDFEFDNSKAMDCGKLQMDLESSKQCGLGADDH